jgi:hypothetical protein
MAEKKVPQEPCIFCSENPCACGQSERRSRAIKTLATDSDRVVTDHRTEEFDEPR